MTVRDERSFECYSRGAELIGAIREMWARNRSLPPGSNQAIAERISALRAEYDLTLTEWHAWARTAAYRC